MNKSLISLAIILAGCSTPSFDGYDTALQINSQINRQRYGYDNPNAMTYDWNHNQPAKVMLVGDAGKCGDFALTKCNWLKNAGFDKNRLSLVWYKLPQGSSHALCVIDGKWAMDWQNHPRPIADWEFGAESNYTPWNVNF